MPTILLKRSNTPGAVPTTANLTNLAGGVEVAVNTADKRMYSMTSASAVIELGTNPSSLTCADASLTVARIGSLTVSSLSLSNVTVTSATVTTLTGTSANITTVTGTTAGFASANITQFQATSATITTLTGTSANVTNASAGSLTITSGNLTFSSTGQRITGDFSDATLANRVMVQSSTTNGNTQLELIPNGTATTANIIVSSSSSDPANTSFGSLLSAAAEVRLQSGIRGTGTYLPMTFFTGGSERMRLDTSGNVGIGTTPTAGLTPRLQVSSAFSAATASTPYNGVFVESSDAQAADKGGVVSLGGLYDASSGPTRFAAIAGLKENGTSGNYAGYLAFYSRANGSSPAERMRIDSSGNVGIGTASPGVIADIKGVMRSATWSLSGTGVTGGTTAFSAGTVSTDANWGMYFRAGTGSSAIAEYSFRNAADTERMRIDSSGNVGIGGTAGADTRVQVLGTAPSSGGQSRGYLTTQTIPSSTTTNFIGFGSVPATQAASFTCSQIYHYYAAQGSLGAGSAVTTQYGYFADSTLTGATNNYGFYSNIASGSNRWNFYAAGTASNFFAGTNNGFGGTDAAARLVVRGVSTTSADYSLVCQNSTPATTLFVRNDGIINTGTQAASPYNNTTGSAANMFVDNTGTLFRSTSSLRYKTNVVDAAHGLADVLKLRSVTYKGKNDGDKVFGGLIAEEVHDAGLTEFVAYDNEGRPDALHYGNMVALLVKAVQELKAELEALKAK